MKNIAIVLGVTNYQRITKLPGSFNDAESIYKILLQTEKYEEILYLNEDKLSNETKDIISDFIERYKGQEINEVLFYFSGHGELINEEFYYLLVDHDTFKRNVTSLQNSVVDSWIRSLNPQLAVKVIDACNSGNQYIKDSMTINTYLNDSKSHLKNCYFLFSSQSDQSSFQTRYISSFTNSFINALKSNTSTEVRYRNIIDFIADEFSSNADQRPLFVIQAENTEKFCYINESLRKYLDEYTGNNPSRLKESLVNKSTLASAVIEQSQIYCSSEEALSILESIRDEVNTFTLDPEIEGLYNFQINYPSTYDNIIDLNAIAKFLAANNEESNYFVKINYITTTSEEPIYNSPYYIGESYVTGQQTGTKLKEIVVPDSFDLNFEPSFKQISIDAIPNYDNLITYNCKILYVINRKFIRFFTCINYYVEDSWVSKKINLKVKWKTEEFLLKDEEEIKTYLKKTNDSLNETIINKLKENYNIEIKTEKEQK